MKFLHPVRRSKGKERNGNSSRGLLLKLELPSDPSLLCAVRGAVERLTEYVRIYCARLPRSHSRSRRSTDKYYPPFVQRPARPAN